MQISTRPSTASRRLRRLVVLTAILGLVPGVALARSGFVIRGAQLTRQPSGAWTGPATLDGVKGTLTLTGTVVLLSEQPHKIHFRWTAGKRLVSGCSFSFVLTRPHGVQLWQGNGQITKVSRQERTYRDLHITLNGPTLRDDLTHAKISIGGLLKPGPDGPFKDC